MPAGRGGLAGGKKELGSHGIWRILQNFLEHSTTLLKKSKRKSWDWVKAQPVSSCSQHKGRWGLRSKASIKHLMSDCFL